MRGQPAHHGREVAQEVEHHHADAHVPPAPFWHHRLIHTHAVFIDKSLKVIAQGLIKLAIVDDQVRFQIER